MNKKKMKKMGGKLYAICIWTVRVLGKIRNPRKG